MLNHKCSIWKKERKKNSSREIKYYLVNSGGAVRVCLHVQWCFLWWRAGHISISCRHSRLFDIQLRLWRRWMRLLGVTNSCGPLRALVPCSRRHTSTSWPDIGLNTNSCSSHPRQVTVVRSSQVIHTRLYKDEVSRDWDHSHSRTNPI